MTERVSGSVARILAGRGLRGARVAVGLSGGIDSVALLDVLDRLRTEFALVLSAVHVNHGLSTHAAEWEAFCAALCAERSIPLISKRVQVSGDGSGIEAAARRQRYDVFARLDADAVALAHHRDDQVETFLLQLLRGAGAKGLAAMPEIRATDHRSGTGCREDSASRPAPLILRPLLDVSREEIDVYVRARGLAWVEDESNADSGYDRNYLRNTVLPLIEARFPGYRDTLARTSRNLADYALLADALAELDWQSADVDAIPVERLRQLADVRALNLLRHFFARRNLPMPPRDRLTEALRQCREAAADAEVHVVFGAHGLRIYRGVVTLRQEPGDFPELWQAEWDGHEALQLPGGLGWLRARAAIGEGIAMRHFAHATATVRGRVGGERLQPAGNRPHRPLKKLFQEAAVPPWERSRMPLLFFGERLAWVPAIGVAAEFRAEGNERGIVPEWERG